MAALSDGAHKDTRHRHQTHRDGSVNQLRRSVHAPETLRKSSSTTADGNKTSLNGFHVFQPCNRRERVQAPRHIRDGVGQGASGQTDGGPRPRVPDLTVSPQRQRPLSTFLSLPPLHAFSSPCLLLPLSEGIALPHPPQLAFPARPSPRPPPVLRL